MYRDRTYYVRGGRVSVGMARRPKIRDRVAETLDEIAEEYEYSTTDEAVTHVLREAGYEV